MKTFRSFLAASFAAVLLAACQGEEVTSPIAESDPGLRAAKATAPGYTPVEIPLLPGDVEGYAPTVNNSGQLGVWSAYVSMNEPRRGRWFVRAGSQNFLFNSVIYDLSNSPNARIPSLELSPDGYGLPTVWTFSESAGFSGPEILDYSPGNGGTAQVVNNVGQTAGTTQSGGAVWNADGTRTEVPNPDPSLFESTQMRDINSRADIAITMWDNDRNHHRGYVRLADGAMILLPPVGAHVSSLARGVSEVVDGKLFVAGTTDDRQGNYRAVRWTVDIAAQAIVATQVRSDRSYSMDMADDGTITGDLAATSGTTAFVWRPNNTTVTLKAPKGLSSPSAYAISDNGKYISGQAKSGGYGKPVYWVSTQ
jgi:hypothetical protein